MLRIHRSAIDPRIGIIPCLAPAPVSSWRPSMKSGLNSWNNWSESFKINGICYTNSGKFVYINQFYGVSGINFLGCIFWWIVFRPLLVEIGVHLPLGKIHRMVRSNDFFILRMVIVLQLSDLWCWSSWIFHGISIKSHGSSQDIPAKFIPNHWSPEAQGNGPSSGLLRRCTFRCSTQGIPWKKVANVHQMRGSQQNDALKPTTVFYSSQTGEVVPRKVTFTMAVHHTSFPKICINLVRFHFKKRFLNDVINQWWNKSRSFCKPVLTPPFLKGGVFNPINQSNPPRRFQRRTCRWWFGSPRSSAGPRWRTWNASIAVGCFYICYIIIHKYEYIIWYCIEKKTCITFFVWPFNQVFRIFQTPFAVSTGPSRWHVGAPPAIGKPTAVHGQGCAQRGHSLVLAAILGGSGNWCFFADLKLMIYTSIYIYTTIISHFL